MWVDNSMAEVTEYYDRREYNPNEDEISLLDLYLVLARRKTTIIITLVIVLLICSAYLLLAPKVYRTSVMILPPDPSALYLATMANADLTSFTSKDVYEKVKSALKSKHIWDDFVKKNSAFFPTSSGVAVGAGALSSPLDFTKDKDFPGEHTIVQYDTGDKGHAKNIFSQYIMFAVHAYVSKLFQDEQDEINRKIASIESDITLSRQKATANRKDEITRLEANLAIARKLGIKDNQLVSIKNPQALTVVTSNLNTLGYMRGVKVLTAELAELKQRQSNDAYIPGLRAKQIALQRLQSIKFTPEAFKPLRLDGQVTTPAKIKPKAKLVLALGIVLGLMLGVFAAFFMEFFQKARSAQR